MNIEKIVLRKKELEEELKKARKKIKSLEKDLKEKVELLENWDKRWNDIRSIVATTFDIPKYRILRFGRRRRKGL